MNKKLIPLLLLFALLIITALLLLIKPDIRFNILNFDTSGPKQGHDKTPRFQLTQAIEVCKDRIKQTNNFSGIHYDSLSSRYEKKSNVYALFFKLERKKLYRSKKGALFVCRVSAANNNILDFSIVNSSI